MLHLVYSFYLLPASIQIHPFYTFQSIPSAVIWTVKDCSRVPGYWLIKIGFNSTELHSNFRSVTSCSMLKMSVIEWNENLNEVTVRQRLCFRLYAC
jgi:hypothetical protein